jgi:hypothetical protein
MGNEDDSQKKPFHGYLLRELRLFPKSDIHRVLSRQ